MSVDSFFVVERWFHLKRQRFVKIN